MEEERQIQVKKKNNHLNAENMSQYFLIMLPSNTYRGRLLEKGDNKKTYVQESELP